MCISFLLDGASLRALRYLRTGVSSDDWRWGERLVVLAMGVHLLLSVGCVSLDARHEVEQAAAHVGHVVGVPAETLLQDEEAARAKTDALLADGLTNDEAVQIALLNNPRARAAMLDVGVSRADFVQSTLFSNPTLTLSFRFPDGGGLANFEAAVSQNIAELWLIPVRKQVAQRKLDRTILQSANALAAIAWDARMAHTGARMASEQEALARDTLDIFERLVEVSELRRRAGTGSEIDVNLARTMKLEAETSLRNARLATIEARSALARVLGISQSPMTLDLGESLPEPDTWAVSAESLQKLAQENRLDLQIAGQSVAEAEAGAREERRRFLKSVQVGFAMERIERRPQARRDWLEETFYDSLQSGQLSPPSFMPRDDQTNDVILGPTLGVELPLWDQNQAQIAKADRLLAQAVQWRDALLVDVAQDIHARLARVKTATENATFYRDEQLPAARRNVELSREAYKVGRLPFLSVLEAERSFLAARGGYLDALEDAALATVGLEQVTGRPAAFLLEQGGTRKRNEQPKHSTSEVK